MYRVACREVRPLAPGCTSRCIGENRDVDKFRGREPTHEALRMGEPWDRRYHDGPAPWDIERPQPAVVREHPKVASRGPCWMRAVEVARTRSTSRRWDSQCWDSTWRRWREPKRRRTIVELWLRSSQPTRCNWLRWGASRKLRGEPITSPVIGTRHFRLYLPFLLRPTHPNERQTLRSRPSVAAKPQRAARILLGRDKPTRDPAQKRRAQGFRRQPLSRRIKRRPAGRAIQEWRMWPAPLPRSRFDADRASSTTA